MIAPMTKVQVAVSRARAEELLCALQEAEVLHIAKLQLPAAPAGSDGGGEESLDFQLANLHFALEFIGRVRDAAGSPPKKSWRDVLAGKPAASLVTLERMLKSLQLEELMAEVHAASDELTGLDGKLRAVREAKAALLDWQDLDITGADLAGTEHVQHFLLRLSLPEELLIKRRLTQVPTAAWQEVKRVATKKTGRVCMEIVVGRQQAGLVQAIVQETNAEHITLTVPDAKTVAAQVAALTAQADSLQRQHGAGLQAAARWIALERTIQFAYDALLHQQERRRARRSAVTLAHAEIFSGWIPNHRLPEVRRQLALDLPAVALEEVTPRPEETAPTQFLNTPRIQAFEAVTDIFGKPKYTELDPTAPMALFFLVAFGLALTDAGYGLIMMGATWAAEKYLRLTRATRKMVRLFFYAGASTVVFGALTGGWFGITLESKSGELADLLLALKVLDPITEPMTLLLVALAVGVVQLLFAWVVRGYDHFRQGDFAAVIFDDVLWIIMVIVLLAWAAASRGIAFTPFAEPLKLAALAAAGALVATQGRHYKNILLKLGGGVLSLYGLVNFLSDTLSYSRLLALGLATGIIALVVNLLGSMVYEAVPGIGWLLAVVVLIVGHTFNLGINVLGAFIHSGRLQFVEFFPKFLEGGGTPYKPLGRVSRYVANPQEFT